MAEVSVKFDKKKKHQSEKTFCERAIQNSQF